MMAAYPRDGTGDGSVPGGGLWARLGALFAPRQGHTQISAAEAVEGPVPPLVRVLAGNPVTSLAVLSNLNTADARHLRRLHPAVAGVVAAIPWRDADTVVVDVVRWRTALPAAVGVRLHGRAVEWKLARLTRTTVWAALSGIMHLDLRDCAEVADTLLLRLPTSLRVLNVSNCHNLTGGASFAHLAALASLDCSRTAVVSNRTDGLPASLQELDISGMYELLSGASLAHLRQLRVLRADWSAFDNATLASLPSSLQELHAAHCCKLTPTASFAHLTALRTLDIKGSAIGNGSLASVSPCLVSLNARGCFNLSSAAALPHLPALQMLDVSNTAISDELVASLPASLIELRLTGCRGVTAGARLDHVRALRVLQCSETELAPAVLAACRTRGCVVPAVRQLRGHDHQVSLVVLGDGRLVSRDSSGAVRLWDEAGGGEALAVHTAGDAVRALAALRDGRHSTICTASWDGGGEGRVLVWDVGAIPPACRATIKCHHHGVRALAALTDGRLAAGCADGAVRVVDVDAGAVVSTLAGHTAWVTALAVLSDSALASGSSDTSVRVWDLGADVCVAVLAGHTSPVTCLAMLTDDRLASSGAESDDAVWLWDVGARACVGVLSGYAGRVNTLAALPDGRLATGSADGTIRLWDTQPAAAASSAVGAVPVEVAGLLGGSVWALLSLPDGRFAIGCSDGRTGEGTVFLLELLPPAA